MQSSRARGVMLMLFAVAIFSVMDLCLKVLSTRLGPLQLATLRGAASLPFVLLSVVAGRRLRDLRVHRIGLHVVRGLLSVLMISAFAYAVRLMSLSNVYTLFMVAPLMVTAVSVPLLGERVRKGAWIAIFVGLAGTLVLLRPSTTGINLLGALAALVCAGCYTVSYVLARVMSKTETADSLVFWVLAMMSVFSAVLGWGSWQPIPSSLWGWIALIGVTGAVAQQCITRAFMLAPASVIAPFEYTALIWGALFDWLIWSTHPGVATVLGALLIVSSGIYVMAAGGPESEPAAGVTAEPHP